MDIKDRIVEMIVTRLVAHKINEEDGGDDGMDNAKGDAVRAAFHRRKFKKAIGKNTRQSTLGGKGKGNSEYKARMAAGKKSPATPKEEIDKMGMKNDAERRRRDAKAEAIGIQAMSKVKDVK